VEKVKPDSNLVCDECGRYGAVDFGERKLCLDCYESSGSCCPEFGREAKEDKEQKRTEP
jgi:hypothetical protein